MKKLQKNGNGKKGEERPSQKELDVLKGKLDPLNNKNPANAMIIDGLKDKIFPPEPNEKKPANAIIVDDITDEAVVELFKEAGDRPLRAYVKKAGTEWIGCLKSEELDRATFLISGPDGVREVEAKDGDIINVGGMEFEIHVVSGSVDWKIKKD